MSRKDKQQTARKKIEISIPQDSVKPESFEQMLQRVRESVHKKNNGKHASPFLLDLSGATPKKIIREQQPRNFTASMKKFVQRLPISRSANEQNKASENPIPKNWNHELKFFKDVMTLKHAQNEQAFLKMIPEANIETPISISSRSKPARSMYAQWERIKSLFHTHKLQLTSLVLVYMLVASPVLAAAYYHKLSSSTASIKQSITDTEHIINQGNPIEQLSVLRDNTESISKALNDLDTALLGLLDTVPFYGSQIQALSALLEAQDELYELSENLISDIAALQNDPNPTHALHFAIYKLPAYLNPLENILDPVLDVEPDLIPEKYRSEFKKGQAAYSTVKTALRQITHVSQFTQDILGSSRQQRYLLLFQNNYELRASGGFLGSYALIDVFQGKIKNIEVPGGGLYDLQGQLLKAVHPPKPLTLITDTWETHDANWYFDWPMSAQKIQEFYYASGGPTIDGVITLNTHVLKEILLLTGPINVPSHNLVVTADNFFDVIQNEVEFGDDKKQNKPKRVIGSLLDQMLPLLDSFTINDRLSLLDAALNLLDSKDIMVWFTDETLQNQASNYGWTGEIKQTKRDYLAIVESNIGGAKTNGVITQQVNVHSDIRNDGSITNTLTITRTHNGEEGHPLTGVNNIEYLRVYVPWKSTLIKADGFSTPPRFAFDDPNPHAHYDEQLLAYERKIAIEDKSKTDVFETNGKTAFGNWIQLKPGQSQTVELIYELPFKLGFPEKEDQSWAEYLSGRDNEIPTIFHSILIQRQSGNWNPTYTVDIAYPNDWNLASPQTLTFQQQKDALIPFIFTRK